MAQDIRGSRELSEVDHECRNAIVSLEGILKNMGKLSAEFEKEYLRCRSAVNKMISIIEDLSDKGVQDG